MLNLPVEINGWIVPIVLECPALSLKYLNLKGMESYIL